MPKMHMWFYNPKHDASGLVNKLVSRIDPPFCHCELQFTDGKACSIYMGSNVLMKARGFESNNYSSVELDCAQVAQPLCVLPPRVPAPTALRVRAVRRR